ncbi:4-coumarate--CoA ligase-like 6 [Gossypium australe]|uniref:4-coumarate--CoA ligase n=1 Tax=Gossypium australe TaxID=47621 RepID=A0A5B6VJP3_9ROSI|nr:4-coumarate--CoA ligase-like 6 [Gossypium australe]
MVFIMLLLYQIAPADLEAVLISHPEILDAAVTSAADEVCGEIPVAFLVRRHGSTLTKGAVIDFVANQVAPYKKVRRVVFTESIPKSAAGKILRKELKSFISKQQQSAATCISLEGIYISISVAKETLNGLLKFENFVRHIQLQKPIKSLSLKFHAVYESLSILLVRAYSSLTAAAVVVTGSD